MQVQEMVGVPGYHGVKFPLLAA